MMDHRSCLSSLAPPSVICWAKSVMSHGLQPCHLSDEDEGLAQQTAVPMSSTSSRKGKEECCDKQPLARLSKCTDASIESGLGGGDEMLRKCSGERELGSQHRELTFKIGLKVIPTRGTTTRDEESSRSYGSATNEDGKCLKLTSSSNFHIEASIVDAQANEVPCVIHFGNGQNVAHVSHHIPHTPSPQLQNGAGTKVNIMVQVIEQENRQQPSVPRGGEFTRQQRYDKTQVLGGQHGDGIEQGLGNDDEMVTEEMTMSSSTTLEVDDIKSCGNQSSEFILDDDVSHSLEVQSVEERHVHFDLSERGGERHVHFDLSERGVVDETDVIETVNGNGFVVVNKNRDLQMISKNPTCTDNNMYRYADCAPRLYHPGHHYHNADTSHDYPGDPYGYNENDQSEYQHVAWIGQPKMLPKANLPGRACTSTLQGGGGEEEDEMRALDKVKFDEKGMVSSLCTMSKSAWRRKLREDVGKYDGVIVSPFAIDRMQKIKFMLPSQIFHSLNLIRQQVKLREQQCERTHIDIKNALPEELVTHIMGDSLRAKLLSCADDTLKVTVQTFNPLMVQPPPPTPVTDYHPCCLPLDYILDTFVSDAKGKNIQYTQCARISIQESKAAFFREGHYVSSFLKVTADGGEQ